MYVSYKATDKYTYTYPKMAVITLCGLHGYTVPYNNSGIPLIITVSFPVVWILNTCEEKLWNSKLAVFLRAVFFSLSKQSSDRTVLFCTCTLLPWLPCQEWAFELIQEVSVVLMQPQHVAGQILQGMRGQVVSDMFSRYSTSLKFFRPESIQSVS